MAPSPRAVTLWCDESGGASIGAMTFAAVALTRAEAEAAVARYRVITGLRGELKGSRISPVERGLLFEILAQSGARGWVVTADAERLRRSRMAGEGDLALYSRLLDAAVAAWRAAGSAPGTDIVIDDGRYDPAVLDRVRRDVQASLANGARAALADSDRCAGIQIADVVANSVLNLIAATERAPRIGPIIQPWLDSGRITLIPLPG